VLVELLELADEVDRDVDLDSTIPVSPPVGSVAPPVSLALVESLVPPSSPLSIEQASAAASENIIRGN